MKKLISLIVCLVGFTGSLFSQTDSAFHTSVVFIGGEPLSKKNVSHDRQCVKVDILDFFAGMYGLVYQREMGEVFSFEIGAGLTGKNNLKALLNSGADPIDEYRYVSPYWNEDADEQDNFYDYQTRVGKLGYYFTVMPQFYYTEYGIDGNYVGLKFESRRYNSEANDVDPLEFKFTSSNTLTERESNSLFVFTWGTQAVNSKTVVDFSLGAGIQQFNFNKRDVGRITTVNGTEYRAVVSKFKRSKFYFELNLKFGLYFEKHKK